jgi:chromosome segregation ATPase
MRPARVRAQDPPVTAQQPAVAVPALGEDAARAEVARLEAEIAKFKSQNLGLLPEQFQANVAQLNSLQMMLEQNREALGQIQQQRIALEAQLQNLNSAGRANVNIDSDTRKLLDERVRQVQAQLAALQETLAPQHPSVRRVEQQLAALEGLRASAISQGDQKKALELENSANMLKTEMENLNLQMDEKVKQAAQINRQIAAYQQRIESGPQMEARYAELLREYEVAKGRAAGNVQLSVTFGADGRPQKIEVIRAQGAEQDARAVEWAKTLRSGQAGPKVVTVEVPVNK